ncbi:DUF2567 domain-containing protein [Actinosynnema mirum]|uniref:Uncharacterized protein n=1 Tax=Actinosynnema mirum (strain ATCC 29888 / DSM 43827 / JCM 3225 / NBRC 14064 / NCIMB 13271 / NRRL B-12336 / IMRU 3971 / 101) TaxID=446462 RepID=C6WDB3_ACTMD|nr:DUF2567 domain-containing protein [Actinosynnema mirum]ACU39550.1 hypothetical protein Amir_5736 [Actinosynnema mirum DSM 43827]
MAEQPVDGHDESDGSTTAAQAKLAEAGWPRRGEGADRDEATTRINKAALGGADEKTAVLPKPVVAKPGTGGGESANGAGASAKPAKGEAAKGEAVPVKPTKGEVADAKPAKVEPAKGETAESESAPDESAKAAPAEAESTQAAAAEVAPAAAKPVDEKPAAPKPTAPKPADAVKPPASKADESTQAALAPVDEPEPTPEAVLVAAHVAVPAAAPAAVVDVEPPTERVARPDGLDGYDRQPPAEFWADTSGAPTYPPYAFHRDRPKVVVQRDIPAAIKVFSTTSLLGLPIGLLWAWLAPAQNVVVQSGGFVPVPGESYHRLDSLMVFVLLGLAAGVLTGTGSWMMRELRGPVVMLAATVGSVLAAFLAFRVSAPFSTWRHELASAPVVGEVIRLAPSLDSAWGIVAWPLGTALAYGCLAAWNGMDDLGRRLA